MDEDVKTFRRIHCKTTIEQIVCQIGLFKSQVKNVQYHLAVRTKDKTIPIPQTRPRLRPSIFGITKMVSLIAKGKRIVIREKAIRLGGERIKNVI